MRVSATDVDQWRYWRQVEDMPLEALLIRLRHESAPSAAMDHGRALHRLLEAHAGGELSEVEIDGVRFRFRLDGDLYLPPVREAKAERELGGGVTLVGKVDAIVPRRRVWDHKLTSRFDLEQYADSYQWRIYLWLFGCPQFTYNVFVGDERDGVVVVREVHTFDLYSYPDLERDVLAEVGEFVAFCRQQGV